MGRAQNIAANEGTEGFDALLGVRRGAHRKAVLSVPAPVIVDTDGRSLAQLQADALAHVADELWAPAHERLARRLLAACYEAERERVCAVINATLRGAERFDMSGLAQAWGESTLIYRTASELHGELLDDPGAEPQRPVARVLREHLSKASLHWFNPRGATRELLRELYGAELHAELWSYSAEHWPGEEGRERHLAWQFSEGRWLNALLHLHADGASPAALRAALTRELHGAVDRATRPLVPRR